MASIARSPMSRASIASLKRTRNAQPFICQRCLHASARSAGPIIRTAPQSSRQKDAKPSKPQSRRAPESHDRGPVSKEDTQTDFGALDVLANTPPPASSIDAVTGDGFALSNNTKFSGSAIFLLGGEVFKWRPWAPSGNTSAPPRPGILSGRLLNQRRQWEPPFNQNPWALLDLVWPKPDLLIIGTGPGIVPISPATRKYINGMGIRIEVQDTRNAASQYNLLATERGVQQVAAALIPMGWREER